MAEIGMHSMDTGEVSYFEMVNAPCSAKLNDEQD